MLNVKPIIGLKDGKLIAVAKVRGKNKAMEYLVDSVPENAVAITVLHILSHDDARQLYRKLQEKFPALRSRLMKSGLSSAHILVRGVGVCSKW